MKNKNLIQVLKFTLFSISAGVIQFASCALLYDVLHINYWVSYLVSLVLSVLWNFTFNRKFTFKSANNVPFAMLLTALFYCVFTPLSTWWGSAMDGAGVPGLVVTAFSMIINFVTEFLYQKYIVFKEPTNTIQDKSFDIIMKVLKTDL